MEFVRKKLDVYITQQHTIHPRTEKQNVSENLPGRLVKVDV